jgi:solute:Na+ symporter, SSS family
MNSPLLAVAGASVLTGVDWLAIACYFGVLLCVAWWVVKQRQGQRRRLFPGRAQPELVGHRRVHLRLQHRQRTYRGPGRFRRQGRRGPGPLRIARLVPAGAGLGLCAVSTPARWSSPCRSFWNGAFPPPSRYVLSIVSLVTFIVSKIAVGIFAGGVVFQVLLPEMHLSIWRP